MLVLAVIGSVMLMAVIFANPPSQGPEERRLYEERWASRPLIPGLLTGLPLLLVMLGVGMDATVAILLAGAFWLLVTAAWVWRGRR